MLWRGHAFCRRDPARVDRDFSTRDARGAALAPLARRRSGGARSWLSAQQAPGGLAVGAAVGFGQSARAAARQSVQRARSWRGRAGALGARPALADRESRARFDDADGVGPATHRIRLDLSP